MNNIKEAVRELLRVVALAVIPVVYLSLENGSVDVKAITLVAVIAGLRAIEKFLFENKSKYHLPF